jgi:ribosome biogenesis GTPase
MVSGRIIKSTGSWYTIEADHEEKSVAARLPGKMRLEGLKQTNPVAVGDRVDLEIQEDGTGIIKKVHVRENYLTRRATHGRRGEQIIAANIDLGIVVQSVRQPQFKTGFIDRFLITCEANNVTPFIIINKLDLAKKQDEERLAETRELYDKLGYDMMLISIEMPETMDSFRSHISGKTVTLMGPSGTGKTSILNALNPELNRTTAAVSGFSNKGKHTTTFAELLPVGSRTYVVDTPGIREFGLVDIDGPGLSNFYVEMRELRTQCKYYNCTHVHEPGCAVMEAYENGDIHPERYMSYLQIIESLS